MSADIKAGDLVVVVSPLPCCGYDRGLGRVFTVSAVEITSSVCIHCGHITGPSLQAGVDGMPNCYAQLHRLKKLDAPGAVDDIPIQIAVPA